MIFGIDGGGTRSRLQIRTVPSGDLLSSVEGGCTNLYALEYEHVEQNLLDLIREGCAQAGIDPTSLQSGCIGSAGLDRIDEKAKFAEICKHILPTDCELTLCNDGEILLVGASGSLKGYCLIAGTGSFALGRDLLGTTVRAGGLGYMLGDEGSAVWITMQALNRSLRSIEGRDLNTRLMKALLEYFKLISPSDFIRLTHYHFNKANFAAFSPIVTKYAAEGDELANDILEKAVQELVALVESVHQRLKLAAPILVLSGGVLEHDKIIQPLFRQLLNKRLPDVQIIKPIGNAVEGACMIAMQKLIDKRKGWAAK
ncbi:MAG: BadF/BadG/BcrA/BcrD ATPase family protein [Sphaerochaetaceae bacterium]|jgi:N-acetylglucosamine kinase-like BadF-type ATPase|nr:BadF/BadG/BcrA/BcrD ATPase family protein [Sphaerochaetaceae bacterium]